MGQFGIDLANIHPYRGDGIPETAIAEKCPQGLKVLAPAMRVNSNCQVTEFGWALTDWTDLGDPQNGPSERVQATYTLRAFLDYFSKTGRTSYVHQIADLETGHENTIDGSFGLYKGDWTPRLVATALKRQKEVIGDGSAAAAPLDYRVVTGAHPQMRGWC
jgi:hypothetical protein